LSDFDNDETDDDIQWFYPYRGHQMENAAGYERRDFDFQRAVEQFDNVWDSEDFSIGVAFILTVLLDNYVRMELEHMECMPNEEEYETMRQVLSMSISSSYKEESDEPEIAVPSSLVVPRGTTIH